MKLDKVQFLTCFIAARLGQQSKSLDATSGIDPTVIEKTISETKKSAENYWDHVQGINLKSTPTNKNKSKSPAEWQQIKDIEIEVLKEAKNNPGIFKPWENKIIADLLSKGINQKITPKQANRINLIGEKLGP